jgi:hypothetical protein
MIDSLLSNHDIIDRRPCTAYSRIGESVSKKAFCGKRECPQSRTCPVDTTGSHPCLAKSDSSKHLLSSTTTAPLPRLLINLDFSKKKNDERFSLVVRTVRLLVFGRSLLEYVPNIDDRGCESIPTDRCSFDSSQAKGETRASSRITTRRTSLLSKPR